MSMKLTVCPKVPTAPVIPVVPDDRAAPASIRRPGATTGRSGIDSRRWPDTGQAVCDDTSLSSDDAGGFSRPSMRPGKTGLAVVAGAPFNETSVVPRHHASVTK